MEPVEYREQLHDIVADPDLSVETRIDRVLELGTEYLSLPIGFFTRIDAGTQEIVQSTGDHPLIQPGETCPLDRAYCRRTIEIESPLAIQDADGSSSISETAVETFELGSYIGARIIVRDGTYGTLCFADSETRGESFSKGERYFVELAARLVGYAIERNDYERELAAHETEINEKEEVYRAAVDASFDLVLQIDDDGRFTFVSPTIEDLLGYPVDDYIGEPFTGMLPDQETIDLAEEMYEAVMAGETVEQQYFPLQHRTEDIVLVDIRVTPLYAGDVPPEERTPEDIVGVQGMARDARERHRRERLISVLNRVLRHNLRNDMDVISGFADVLEERLTGEEATYARKISDTSQRLVTLSETARTLEQNLEEPPDVGEEDIVPDVTAAVEQIAERYPDASITITAPDVAVARTAPRLETAVSELLDNAAQHAGEAPSVEVAISVGESRVTIHVRDDGAGLPEQEREVLESGDETPLAHGSGLGLWLVHWIVKSIDGTLTVRNSEQHCIEISLRRGTEL